VRVALDHVREVLGDGFHAAVRVYKHQ
jgi:hypothetical protein